MWSGHGVSASVRVEFLANYGEPPHPVSIVLKINEQYLYYTTRAWCLEMGPKWMVASLGWAKRGISGSDIEVAVSEFVDALKILLHRPEFDSFNERDPEPVRKRNQHLVNPDSVEVYARAGVGCEKLGPDGHARRIIADYPPRRRASLLRMHKTEGRWSKVDWKTVAESLAGGAV